MLERKKMNAATVHNTYGSYRITVFRHGLDSFFQIRKKELGLNSKHLKVKVLLFDSLFIYFII